MMIFLWSWTAAAAWSAPVSPTNLGPTNPWPKDQKWNGTVFEVRTRTRIGREELIQGLLGRSAGAPDVVDGTEYPTPVIFIGEKHYTAAVQKAEASLLREVVLGAGAEGSFTTAWEFLNHTSQETTDRLFGQFKEGALDANEFLRITQGTAAAGVYAPLLEATRDLGGELLGVNLSRAEKAPVIAGGIGALDPALLPPAFALGGEGYFERFKIAMEGHAPPEKIRNYFEAQCLTDDVMAHRLLRSWAMPRPSSVYFLISGSFHMEYFDGTLARFRDRAEAMAAGARPGPFRIKAVRIFDASDYSEAELMGLLHDDRHGDVADYAYFVNEPRSAGAISPD